MIEMRGVYEIAVPVRDLARAEAFYRGVLGLEVGLRSEDRPWLFLRAGPHGMVVLQQVDAAPPRLHFAFEVDDAHLDRAVAQLRERGVAVEDPVVHAWMPARSCYFADPDGHDLELCAPLAAR